VTAGENVLSALPVKFPTHPYFFLDEDSAARKTLTSLLTPREVTFSKAKFNFYQVSEGITLALLF